MSQRGRDRIRLASPETGEVWDVEILFEDGHLLALNKPSGLLTSPARLRPDAPNMIRLLQELIRAGNPTTTRRGWSYLVATHRLDFDTSGVLLLAKNKPALITVANLFGSNKIGATHIALAAGSMGQETFAMDSKLAPDPLRPGKMRVDSKNGKRARTEFFVRQRFKRYTLLECRPQTHRPHQVRVHLQSLGLSILGDQLYGGPQLLLSNLKSDYRLKNDKIERPLISTPALHLERLSFQHPMTGEEIVIDAPWPKDLTVAVKYLNRYSTN
jgi:RluA family pseudouridine synthase